MFPSFKLKAKKLMFLLLPALVKCLSLPCGNPSYVDPASGIEHHCNHLWKITDRIWCEEYCPEFFKCMVQAVGTESTTAASSNEGTTKGSIRPASYKWVIPTSLVVTSLIATLVYLAYRCVKRSVAANHSTGERIPLDPDEERQNQRNDVTGSFPGLPPPPLAEMVSTSADEGTSKQSSEVNRIGEEKGEPQVPRQCRGHHLTGRSTTHPPPRASGINPKSDTHGAPCTSKDNKEPKRVDISTCSKTVVF